MRFLSKLPPEIRSRLQKAVLSLSNPRPKNAIKLIGEPDTWRIRVGNYRIVYEIDDAKKLVTVLRIAHRREVYRR